MSTTPYDESLWRIADKNNDGSITEAELGRLFKKINLLVPNKTVKKLFNDVARPGPDAGAIDRPRFMTLLKQLQHRQDLLPVFESAGGTAAGPRCISRDSFATFLSQAQHCTAQQVSAALAALPTTTADDGITFDAFAEFLMNPQQNLMNPMKARQHMDMTQPLNHYYTESSHNTYLMGDQLQGTSSVQGYIRALQHGCRCVEMDVWDGAQDTPMVYHGHTLTTKITFRSVLEAVKAHAFVASPYPLVLSLEVHCGVKQQDVMAQLLVEIFGDTLLTQPHAGSVLPSPEALRGRVIVKGKALKHAAGSGDNLAAEDDVDEPEDDNDDDDDASTDAEDYADVETAHEGNDAAVMSPQEKKVKQSFMTRLNFLKKRDKNKSPIGVSPSKSATTLHHHAGSVALQSLAVYMQSKKFGSSFAACADSHTFKSVSSFAEPKAISLVRKSLNEFIEFNRRYTSRIYPAGVRVDSSNAVPIGFWAAGCQLVALNYQNFDTGMQLNRGFFQQNGRTGYLLKRESMRAGKPAAIATKTMLKIAVISAVRLPKPSNNSKGEIVDPFVEVELCVPALDQSELYRAEKFRTACVQDNGFNPVFAAGQPDGLVPHRAAATSPNIFKFTTAIVDEELSFLRFTVKDRDDLNVDDLIATYAIPISCMQPGYRHIQLWDSEGEQSAAHLFVWVSLSQTK